ncbi:disulfide bond formation protein DsbA [Halobacteriales archaeon SW_8_65_20]|nr:MAG: disulfide bond formation protein DsbA [Halobacteriales archaeon SW_8_65_20]
MSNTADPEQITVFSDYVCPFCYLGRHSLDQYQATREEPLEIDWRPFDLRAQKRNPDGSIDHSVDDGKDEAYFEQAKENVRRLQAEYDVEMDLELSRDVDSLPAQMAAVRVSEEYDYDTWLGFDRGIFEALWTEGRDIGDADVLADVAEASGVDPDLVRDAVTDEALRERVRGLFEEATQQGVTGVPTFAYDGYGARGAVPPEQLERLVEGN